MTSRVVSNLNHSSTPQYLLKYDATKHKLVSAGSAATDDKGKSREERLEERLNTQGGALTGCFMSRKGNKAETVTVMTVAEVLNRAAYGETMIAACAMEEADPNRVTKIRWRPADELVEKILLYEDGDEWNEARKSADIDLSQLPAASEISALLTR